MEKTTPASLTAKNRKVLDVASLTPEVREVIERLVGTLQDDRSLIIEVVETDFAIFEGGPLKSEMRKLRRLYSLFLNAEQVSYQVQHDGFACDADLDDPERKIREARAEFISNLDEMKSRYPNVDFSCSGRIDDPNPNGDVTAQKKENCTA